MDASSKETWVQDRMTLPCLLLSCLNYFFYCVCINGFSFLFKKKYRLTWFQILACSLMAGQLLPFSEPEFCKGRGNNQVNLARLLWSQ